MSTREYVIGYWKNPNIPDTFQYPTPVENSASDEQVKEMLTNLEAFKKTVIEKHYKGSSNCRLCGKSNGSGEYVQYRNGLRVVIPAGLEHYIRDHKVLVPDLLTIKAL